MHKGLLGGLIINSNVSYHFSPVTYGISSLTSCRSLSVCSQLNGLSISIPKLECDWSCAIIVKSDPPWVDLNHSFHVPFL